MVWAAEPIRIYAAGSLGKVLPESIAASGLPDGTVAAPICDPAGTLRDRLLADPPADLFAYTAGPVAVAAKAGELVVSFARNRMYVLTPERLRLTATNLLAPSTGCLPRISAWLPQPQVPIPGGDCAQSVFKRADTLRPDAGTILAGKVLLLLGWAALMTRQPGNGPAASIFLASRADALLYYCSGPAATAREMPGFVSIPVPDSLEVGPVYGLAVLSDRPGTAQKALFSYRHKDRPFFRVAVYSLSWVKMMRRVLACLTVLVLALPSLARAEDGLRLIAAGSLTEAMTAMLAASGLPPHQIAAPIFGPSGVLRERIKEGAAADVLALADMAQPRRLGASWASGDHVRSQQHVYGRQDGFGVNALEHPGSYAGPGSKTRHIDAGRGTWRRLRLGTVFARADT